MGSVNFAEGLRAAAVRPPSAKVVALQRELIAAFRAKGEVPLGKGELKEWVEAIEGLVVAGRHRPAVHGATALLARDPDFAWARGIKTLIGLLPQTGRFLPVRDDPTRDVMIARRKGAKAVLFFFCGGHNGPGAAIWLFHQWLRTLDLTVVYLRDYTRDGFLGGVASMGPRPVTVQKLKALAEQLEASRILCAGSSAGAFGAMLCGMDLGAEHVLCLGGAFNLEPDFNTYLNRADGAVRIREAFPDQPLDLRALWLERDRPPAATLVYGGKNWDDRLHAEYMADVPRVTLAPIAGLAEHNPVPELMKRRELTPLIASLLEDRP